MGLIRRPGTIERHQLDGLSYSLQYKPISRVNLRLKPSEGNVVITAPYGVSLESIEAFIRRNKAWISRQRKRLAQQPKKEPCAYVSGETVYVWGKPYELLLVTDARLARELCGLEAADLLAREHMASVHVENQTLILACPAEFDRTQRERCLETWLKRQLEAFLPAIFRGCETIVGKKASAWYVRKMKTRWGSCNVRTGRICINLHLSHLPLEYLSYIVTHELVHLWEKGHGERFKARMDLYYPSWREKKEGLRALHYML